MSKLLTMDESGNTQPIAALCLVGMPRQALPRIKEILTVSSNDEPEIITLYNEVMNGEFKYVDLRQAYKRTRLRVYDDFLKKKLQEIARLELDVYYSVFPTPQNNEERLFRIDDEAQYLFHTWAHQHPQDALDINLEILVDQQVFHEKHLFQYSVRRGRATVLIVNMTREQELLKRGNLMKTRFASGTCNTKEILDGNSKTHKTIQISDLLVGCIREQCVSGIEDYYNLIKPLLRKNQTRVQIDSYEIPRMMRVV